MRISDLSSDVCSSDLIPAYFENYLPIRIARALKAKLYHKTRYWTVSEMANTPFVIALQDFHAPASMSTLTPAVTEYVFGVRHSKIGRASWRERGCQYV